MKKLVIVLVAMFAVALVARVSVAEEAAKSKEIKGILIDNMCGDKMVKKDDPEAAAKDHKVACALKCADSGFGVLSEKKLVKFDENGNKLAKEYLGKEDAKTSVVVKGEVKEDGTIAVTSIDAGS